MLSNYSFIYLLHLNRLHSDFICVGFYYYYICSCNFLKNFFPNSVYICVCVFICVYIHVYMCIYVHAYMCIYTCLYVYICTCLYMYMLIYVYMYMLICVYIHAYMCIYMLICVYIHAYMCIYTCLYVYIRTCLYVYICTCVYVYACLCVSICRDYIDGHSFQRAVPNANKCHTPNLHVPRRDPRDDYLSAPPSLSPGHTLTRYHHK